MPVPGAGAAREAASPCPGSADARVRNAVGALQTWGVACCLPQPFDYLPQQITHPQHLGAEENLALEGAHVWDPQHLYFWGLLVYPVAQLRLSSQVVVSPLKDYSGLSLICLLTQITEPSRLEGTFQIMESNHRPNVDKNHH